MGCSSSQQHRTKVEVMTLGHNICQQGDNICLDYIDTLQPVAIPSATINKSSASHKVAIPSATLGKNMSPYKKTNYICILQKAMIGMNSEAQFQHNKVLKLDNTMLIYGDK